MAKGSDVALALVGGGIAVGVVAAVYYSFNQGPSGGSCDCTKDPGSPCCQALTPYQQEYQTCANQYSALWAQIVQGGQAPTSAQQAELDSLKSCMDQAAKNIADTARNFVPQNAIQSLVDDIGEAILVVAIGIAAAYGLKGLGSFISARRASGQLKTTPATPAGIAALMTDGMIQYAAANSLITLNTAAGFRTSVDVNASNDLYNLANYFDALVQLQVFDQAFATSQISIFTNTINFDANTTVSALPF